MDKIKDRPLQSKAERELEKALEAKYRSLGNEELVAALRHQQQASQTPTKKSEQQG